MAAGGRSFLPELIEAIASAGSRAGGHRACSGVAVPCSVRRPESAGWQHNQVCAGFVPMNETGLHCIAPQRVPKQRGCLGLRRSATGFQGCGWFEDQGAHQHSFTPVSFVPNGASSMGCRRTQCQCVRRVCRRPVSGEHSRHKRPEHAPYDRPTPCTAHPSLLPAGGASNGPEPVSAPPVGALTSRFRKGLCHAETGAAAIHNAPNHRLTLHGQETILRRTRSCLCSRLRAQ
jgi:hypothetical protein